MNDYWRFANALPNPVLQMSTDGVLIYANIASGPILAHYSVTTGVRMPDALREQAMLQAAEGAAGRIDLACSERFYTFRVSANEEESCIDLYGTDITEFKHETDSQRDAIERLNLAMEAAHLGAWDYDISTETFYGDDRARSIACISENRLQLHRALQIFHPDDLESVYQTLREATDPAIAKPISQEYRILRPDCSIRWIAVNGLTRFSDDGPQSRPVKLVGTVMDITERKQYEEALRLSEERLVQAIAAADLGIFEHNHLTGGVQAFGAFRSIAGFGEEDPITVAAIIDRILPEDRNEAITSVRRSHDPTGDGFFFNDSRFKLPNGQIRWIRAQGKTSFEGESENRRATRTVGTALDITDQKRYEEHLYEAGERYRIMGEILPYGIWWCNDHGGAEYVSQSFLDLLEMTMREIREFGWSKRLPPDEVEPMMKRWMHCVKTGEDWDDEHHVLGPDGKYHTVLTRGKAVRDRDGRIIGWAGINLDIDERKRKEEELQRATAELQRSNKDLEQFAYVASHDLQEPLHTIASFARLLEKNYRGKLDKDADEFIKFITDGADRMHTLIFDLLAYSRVGSQGKPLEAISAEQALADALESLKQTIEDTNALVTRDSLPTIKGDRVQIAQLFQNLISNGIKFRRQGVRPEVRISIEERKEDYLFRVTDNGIGIDPKYHDKIFTIFQRLHSTQEYKGTGIGLAICKRIVERHGGQIWVESALGQETSFFFTLPKY